jgi:Competence protein J (ComJ)
MQTELSLEVTFGQLAVFASSLQNPFNDWTAKHVAQGFAWRPGSVSFRTLVEAGTHIVEVRVVRHLESVSPSTLRAIEVPFQVPDNGEIEIASISDSVPLFLKPGSVLLRCEFLGASNGSDERVQLLFAMKDTPRFAVVRADSQLSVNGDLLTSAAAATA